MKRTTEEEAEAQPQFKRPKIAESDPSTTKKDQIKIAVKEALYDGSSDVISNKPIIMQCQGEDCSLSYAMAYWPASEKVGEKLLSYLDDKLNGDEEDIILHVRFVDTLQMIAKGEFDDEKKHKKRRLNFCLILSIDSIKEIGTIALIKSEYNWDTESQSDKEKKPDHWVIEMTQLSPHLYHQECQLFY